jgi:hypothetical protein
MAFPRPGLHAPQFPDNAARVRRPAGPNAGPAVALIQAEGAIVTGTGARRALLSGARKAPRSWARNFAVGVLERRRERRYPPFRGVIWSPRFWESSVFRRESSCI